jgi:hypothetical protein
MCACKNMLRRSSDYPLSCICRGKDRDCRVQLTYFCTGCGYETQMGCHACLDCVGVHSHSTEKIRSNCYDCGMELAHQMQIEDDYYEGW